MVICSQNKKNIFQHVGGPQFIVAILYPLIILDKGLSIEYRNDKVYGVKGILHFHCANVFYNF